RSLQSERRVRVRLAGRLPPRARGAPPRLPSGRAARVLEPAGAPDTPGLPGATAPAARWARCGAPSPRPRVLLPPARHRRGDGMKPGEAAAPITAEQHEHDRPDAHLTVAESGRLTARCSLWWRNAPSIPGQRPGLIGHYSAESAVAASVLLERA